MRVDRGWSESELGRRSGIPVPTLNKKMRGITPFDLNELEKLADAFGAKPTDLLDSPILDALSNAEARIAERPTSASPEGSIRRKSG